MAAASKPESMVQPIFMSPDDDQVKVIQSLLRQRGIDASLITKKKPRNNDALVTNSPSTNVQWVELWLRNESDVQQAKEAITQFQFNVLRTNLQVSEEQHDALLKEFGKTQELPKSIRMAAKNAPLNDHGGNNEAWLPINNKRVFRYLAKLLGLSEQEVEDADQDIQLIRPWNSKSLMETVHNLKQVCR